MYLFTLLNSIDFIVRPHTTLGLQRQELPQNYKFRGSMLYINGTILRVAGSVPALVGVSAAAGTDRESRHIVDGGRLSGQVKKSDLRAVFDLLMGKPTRGTLGGGELSVYPQQAPLANVSQPSDYQNVEVIDSQGIWVGDFVGLDWKETSCLPNGRSTYGSVVLTKDKNIRVGTTFGGYKEEI
ncbi:hypothetical protein BDP27DRAFT_1370972 [Rhodocollybia butyracea]|uniref:Uncharacterized protein n=1 Tax=Rhodocollybia butyracea TaxID=206335 RepID=A0A9P5TZZ3_9AGAR|nr:hypothetical protein BDP27DRAFT_1370972 [Rhodocollybia butyracea]